MKMAAIDIPKGFGLSLARPSIHPSIRDPSSFLSFLCILPPPRLRYGMLGGRCSLTLLALQLLLLPAHFRPGKYDGPRGWCCTLEQSRAFGETDLLFLAFVVFHFLCSRHKLPTSHLTSMRPELTFLCFLVSPPCPPPHSVFSQVFPCFCWLPCRPSLRSSQPSPWKT